MMRLSEGCPRFVSHTATVNNTRAFVYALSRLRGNGNSRGVLGFLLQPAFGKAEALRQWLS